MILLDDSLVWLLGDALDRIDKLGLRVHAYGAAAHLVCGQNALRGLIDCDQPRMLTRPFACVGKTLETITSGLLVDRALLLPLSRRASACLFSSHCEGYFLGLAIFWLQVPDLVREAPTRHLRLDRPGLRL